MEDNRRRFIGHRSFANGLTMSSIVVSVLGLMFGIFLGLGNFIVGMGIYMVALVYSGIIDMIDGMVARKTKRTDHQKLYGMSLDSLADAINFGICPAIYMVFTYLVMFDTTDISFIWFILAVISSVFMVCCCIERLSWFNSTELLKPSKGKYTIGVPVTYIAILIPLLRILWMSFVLITGESAELICFIEPMLIVLISFGMILNVKVKKPNKLLRIKLGIFGVALAIVWILIINYIISESGLYWYYF